MHNTGKRLFIVGKTDILTYLSGFSSLLQKGGVGNNMSSVKKMERKITLVCTTSGLFVLFLIDRTLFTVKPNF